MRIMGNPIERYWGCEACTDYVLYENNNMYYYNKFMDYWEESESRKFYRWKTKADETNMKELRDYYYETLSA